MNETTQTDGQLPADWSRMASFGQSWLSLKTWVKTWLWFVNVVFWLALLFWYHTESRWILLAYAATGPFLFGQALWQRGLTRLLGLAHIIPWLPLLIYLSFRVFSDRLGQQISYASDPAFHVYLLIMLLTLTICLVLDIFDVIRWFRGERYVLGSRDAHRLGASCLAQTTQETS